MTKYSKQPGPIGIFDSGYGGLTILHGIRQLLPEYDYLYLGDNARAPYGSRSFDVVYQFTRQAVMKLFIGCPSLLFLCNVIGPCSCIAFKRAHIIDFDNHLNWLVDVDWYYRLQKGKRRKFLDHLHINSFNDHEDKITNQIDVKQSEVKDIAILNIKYKYHLLLRCCLSINKMVMLYDLKGIIKKLIRK